MADQSKVLEAMASQLTAVAAGLEALRVQGAAQTAANAETADKLAEMQQRISQHDGLLTGDWSIGAFHGCTSGTPARLGSSDPTWRRRFLTAGVQRGVCGHDHGGPCRQKVGPALQAAFSQVGAELVNHAVKINTLEHEVRMLKIRTAWTEKDLMYSQIEAAKRLVVHTEWATAADRELTVAEALKENNLGYLEWDLTTMTMEGTDGKKFLAPISILTVQTYGAHKKVMDACSRAVVRYWHEVKDEAGHEKDGRGRRHRRRRRTERARRAPAHRTPRGRQATPTPKMTTWEKGARPGPHRRSGRSRRGTGTFQLRWRPGSRSFERLGAPLHGLMNAYQRLFARFKKETLVPRWKTLILEDKEGAWLGRSPLQPQSLEPHRNDGHSGGLEV